MTEDQLLAVAINFAAHMGWIDAPGGSEWHSRMMRRGGPEAFRLQMLEALRSAQSAADVQTACCSLEDLQALRELWKFREEGAENGELSGGWSDLVILEEIYKTSNGLDSKN